MSLPKAVRGSDLEQTKRKRKGPNSFMCIHIFLIWFIVARLFVEGYGDVASNIDAREEVKAGWGDTIERRRSCPDRLAFVGVYMLSLVLVLRDLIG